MSNILVTGGAGFIGSWIARELVMQGHYVVVADDLSGGNVENIDSISNSKNFKLSKIHLSDPYSTDILFRDGHFEYVYHLAANAREGASFFQPVSVVRRNTMAYTTVLMNAIKYNVRRIILFSSIAAYGHQEAPFTEKMPLKPVDIYGLQKANMEGMTKMMALCHNFEYIIFRPFNVYGPYQALNDPFRNALAIWMNKVMLGEPIQIYGDGQQRRSFSYIEDSLPCYIKAMGAKSGEVYNIGSNTPYTIKQAAMMTVSAMGKDPTRYPYEYLPFRHGEVKEAYSENGKAKEELGFVENHSFGEGLVKMAQWAKKMGPQRWRTGDPIEIYGEKLPGNWR